MVFYLSGSTRCVVIMPQAFTGNRTVGGELFLCPYHMMVAVSYTHLDVYKRQTYAVPAPESPL